VAATLTVNVRKSTRSIQGAPVQFLVRMDVHLPHDMPQETADDLRAREKARAQEIQRAGKWPELWRVVGRYANVSRFDVDSPDELHQLLSSLPLFPYMDIELTALTVHPSKLDS
jgi:muconolactone D-isomerase